MSGALRLRLTFGVCSPAASYAPAISVNTASIFSLSSAARSGVYSSDVSVILCRTGEERYLEAPRASGLATLSLDMELQGALGNRASNFPLHFAVHP